MSETWIWSSELYHHGIRGQRWGIRRFQNEDGTLTPAGLRRQAKIERIAMRQEVRNAKARAKADRKISMIGKNVKTEKLSNEELKARIDRLNLEKEYKTLKNDVKGISAGKEFINKILDHAAQKEANKLKMEELNTRKVEALQRAEQAKQNAKQAKQQAKQAEANAERDATNKRANRISARNERRRIKMAQAILRKHKNLTIDKISAIINGANNKNYTNDKNDKNDKKDKKDNINMSTKVQAFLDGDLSIDDIL